MFETLFAKTRADEYSKDGKVENFSHVVKSLVNRWKFHFATMAEVWQTPQ